MSNLEVDKENMRRNFEMNKNLIAAEPLYILLAMHGHPHAHEYIRGMALKSQLTRKPLMWLIKNDKEIKQYLKKFSKSHRDIIENPEKYTGIAEKKTEIICGYWKGALNF